MFNDVEDEITVGSIAVIRNPYKPVLDSKVNLKLISDVEGKTYS